MSALGFETHDHAGCIVRGLAQVDRHCAEKRLQFTPVRRRVMEILLEQHKAMGAYDILDILRSEGLGSQPPVAYRALDFLVSHGFAHRIERLNAFIACAHPEAAAHAPSFLICRSCNAVAETPCAATQGRLGQAARDAGFQIERAVMEAEGLCPSCQNGAS